MSIFLRELKSHRNSLIFWSIGMFFLILASMEKFSAYSSSGQSMNSVITSLPKMVQVVFGISGFDLSTVAGFFGVVFMYIALMGSVHAVLIGSDLISKEERDKTSEFLFAKPITRAAAVTAKILAGLFNLIIFNIITTVSSIYLVRHFNSGTSADHGILVLMAGLFFLQLIFFSIGTAAGAISKKPKAASGTATSILMIAFFLYFLINLSDKLDFLKFLTPFKYFDAKTLLDAGKLDPVYVILSLIITLLLIASTYRFYSKRDLNV